jgi:hypothetical protein
MEAILFLIDLIAMFLLVRWSAKMDRGAGAASALKDSGTGRDRFGNADRDFAAGHGSVAGNGKESVSDKKLSKPSTRT